MARRNQEPSRNKNRRLAPPDADARTRATARSESDIAAERNAGRTAPNTGTSDSCPCTTGWNQRPASDAAACASDPTGTDQWRADSSSATDPAARHACTASRDSRASCADECCTSPDAGSSSTGSDNTRRSNASRRSASATRSRQHSTRSTADIAFRRTARQQRESGRSAGAQPSRLWSWQASSTAASPSVVSERQDGRERLGRGRKLPPSGVRGRKWAIFPAYPVV